MKVAAAAANAVKPDLVYLVGPGSDHHPELRWSLRSVAANMPHADVWIVGHKPSWVTNVNWIPTAQVSRNKYVNTLRNWHTALHHPHVSNKFVLMNDDFYAMHPGKPAEVRTRGTMTDVLASVGGVTTRNGDYWHQVDTCRRYLIERGITTPMSYELHVPLPVDKQAAAEVVSTLPAEPHTYGYSQRSTYGNLANIGGEPMRDVRPIRQSLAWWEWPWLSSRENQFTAGSKDPIPAFLWHRFPTPGPYEDPATAPKPPSTTLWIYTDTTASRPRIKLTRGMDDVARRLVDSGVWRAV